MTTPEHPTPAAAALHGFPPGASVLFEDRSGDWAIVLVETGSTEHPYPYEVLCERRARTDGADAWFEVGGANGPGWRAVPGRPTVTFWGTVDDPGSPPRIEFAGRTVDAATNGDHFFFVQWDVAESRGMSWPRVAVGQGGEPGGPTRDT